MQKLNIGMIGAGFIGQLAHFTSFSEVDNCNIIAIAECKPTLCKDVARKYGIKKTYSTHLDLLNDDGIDAVVVVMPRPYTGPVVLDCLNAGKHVLSEKPMTGTKENGRRLLEASYKNDVRYAVGYMKRFDRGVELAKKALAQALKDGSLGEIISVQATCFMGNSYCNPRGVISSDESVSFPLPAWPIAPKWLPQEYHRPFDAYLNTYTHVTNLLRYLFEANPAVQYANLTSNKGQLVVLDFGDFLATLDTGRMSHLGWSEKVVITFTDGEIVLELPPALLRNVPASVHIYEAGTTQMLRKPLVDWSWSFHRQAESFVSDILHNKTMRNSAEEGLNEIELVESIWAMEMKRTTQKNSVEVTC